MEAGLTHDAAWSMDNARLKAYDVTNDPDRLVVATVRHEVPLLVDLPDKLLSLDDESAEIGYLQAQVDRLQGRIEEHRIRRRAAGEAQARSSART